MKFRPSNFIQLPLATIVLFLSFSCNKDSDLLAEYVIEQPQAFMVNDVVVTLANNPVVIKPLSNDNFKEPEKVTITQVTPPKMGTAEVQEDNTVVYTPNTDETGTDEFDYTTTVTNPDNSVSTETGSITVTVTPTDKTSPITGDNVYYVTTTGKSTNNGSTEATAWSIQHAFNTAKAGDVIYVKAGNYGAIYLSVSNGGTANNLIKFIGYKSTPGDVQSVDGPTIKYNDYKNNNNNLDSSQLPLFQGTRNNFSSKDAAISISKNFVSIENFQFRHYDYAIHSKSNNCVFKNIVSTDMGNFNPNDSYNPYYPNASSLPSPSVPAGGTSNLAQNLTGQGIWIAGGQYNIISNSITINGGARGFVIVDGSYNEINNSEVWSDQNVNPTDYYIMIYGGSNNSITGGHIERIGNLTHRGHGLSMKCNSSFNKVSGLTLVNTSIELNGNINNSSFTNVDVIGGKFGGFTGGIKLDSGCFNNTFTNCSNTNGEGLIFLDSVEGDCSNGTSNASHDNTFVNLKISNASSDNYASIAFHWNSQGGRLTSSAYNNKFENCTFEGSQYIFRVDRVSSGNEFVGCTFSNFSKGFRSSRFSINNALPIGVSFSNSTWSNIDFSIPSGLIK